MPVMDGYEASLEIRRLEEKFSISSPAYIVGLTAHTLDIYKDKCFAAKMN